ncbi:permease prefix domain 1-containing protein [Tissierella sp. Yu-01]|uniref:permease prefix domain 1-containing protein n=1 Tax=Tissierella sp. Yu-01 TaxID=3035694 RepID=UPI00240CF5A0|nr:permease prefix domain 1-containing protein [Tissierella sp. Yu-01]WFA08829.1 permease prefix domain 1-containing protein [Tissierella sp. Yu-01]
MNTIRDYLENMFLGLPKTNDVESAKEELRGMMEDKYQELKENGKSENEAIGIVISEFGNLDELADALGIKEVMGQKTEFPLVSYERAMNYIEDSRATSPKTALGVSLCILSPVVLLTLLGLYESKIISVREDLLIAIGIFFVISLVAIAISLFIKDSGRLDAYKDLCTDSFRLDYKTEQMVSKIHKQEEPIYKSTVSISVMLYIFSGLPIIVTPLIIENGGIHILAVVVTLIIIALTTYNIISKGGAIEACRVLLQMEEYTIENKSNTTYKTVSKVYWSVVVAAYLGYSFITNDWSKSWIIWPVAGTLFAAVKAIMVR